MIRDASVADLDALTELAFASKAFWGYDDAFMAACRNELTVTPALLAAGTVRVADEAGTIVGFHGVARDGDEFELTWLFVAPSAMGRGVGAALLADARAVARTAGGEELVIAADPNAVGFYERTGARVVGEIASDSIAGRVLPLMVLAVG